MVEALGLVRVELVNAARLKRLPQPRVQNLWKRNQLRVDGSKTTDRRDVQVRRIGTLDPLTGRQALEGRVKRPIAPGTCW